MNQAPVAAPVPVGFDEGSIEEVIDLLPIWQICLEYAVAAPLDPLALTIAACWVRAPADVATADARARFEAVHQAACRLVGVAPQSSNLGQVGDRSAAERRRSDQAFKSARAATRIFGDHAVGVILDEALNDHPHEVKISK